MVELGIYKQSYLNQLHTRDPFPGYDNLPQSQNGYSYVQDNPVNYTDPSGHCVVLAGVDFVICVTAAAALTVFVANNAIQNNALLDDAIEDLAYMASSAWDDLSCWLSDIGESANDGEENPLLELAGNTASSPGDFDPGDDNSDWKPGDPIDKKTQTGDYPSWQTARSRYWQNRATNAKPSEFSKQNLANMSEGKAPKAKIVVRDIRTGEIRVETVTKELHHISGRSGNAPHATSNLQELWPWEHAKVDPDRFLGYQFLGFK